MSSQLYIVTPDLALLDAAIDGRRGLGDALGGEVAKGWTMFPEALRRTRDAVAADPDSTRWGVRLFILDEPRTLVGWGGFKGPPRDGVVELGYEIAAGWAGRGLATEAVRAMLREAFAATEIRAVIAHTMVGPSASVRVLEKAGFANEGEVPDERIGSAWRFRIGAGQLSMNLGDGSQRAAFRTLHESGCFVIPNPWDAGTARALESMGFRALATTSAGLAFSRALPDLPGSLPAEPVIEHVREIVAATDLPVNADFQAGYAPDPEGVGANVLRCVETGVAGLSIEDTRDASRDPLFELSEAIERVRAAREAIDSTGTDVLLTARAESFLVGHPDPLAESIRRLQAYSEAGGDVLYAPGVRERDHIAAIVEAVHPKPVNVLMSADTGLRVADLADLGVRRVSVGSSLSRVAWAAFLHAATKIAEEGSFAGLDGAAPFAELNALFEEPK